MKKLPKKKTDWLQNKFLQDVVHALGAENIRFVGGAVRDSILGRPVTDIDAATSHLPETVMALLAEAGIKAIPTGIDHGTVTAVRDGRTIEITTLRLDVQTDGRHAEVAFTDSWQADAERRDFTMNAIYLGADGTLYDPVDGLRDLRAGRVRFIGDAAARIQEDALRILRYFRFYTWYGHTELDNEALAACQSYGHLLEALSGERIRQELIKLLSAPNPVDGWQGVLEAKLERHLPSCPDDTEKLQAVCQAEAFYGLKPNALLRLAALFSFDKEKVEQVIHSLKFSNKDQKLFAAFSEAAHAPAVANEKSLRQMIYGYGRDYAAAHVLTVLGEGHQPLMALVQNWPIPSFVLKGSDLIARGVQPGPALGIALKAREKHWVDSDFSLTKDQLLSL